MKKHILGTLILLCLVSAFLVSCSGNEEETVAPESGSTPVESTETQPEEKEDEGNGRSEVKDSLPDSLDFSGSEVRVFSRGGDTDTLMEFDAEEMTGDVVNDAVYSRNLAVQERLNVEMNLILETSVTRHGGTSSKIRASVSAGSNDYDLIANAMHDTMPLVVENMFLPLNTLDYIDFNAPWYNQAFLDTTNLNGNNYTIMGELGQTMISGAFVMFFNKDLFDEFYKGDINLYEVVNSGEWTLDKMTSLCEGVYTDKNGNGVVDDGDIVGHFFTNTLTLGADSFSGASKLDYIKKGDDGTYIYNANSERMVEFTERMHKLLFEGNNTLRTPNNDEHIMDTMLNRSTIFTTWMLSGIDYLRDMEDNFGILPMPKLNEEQEKYTAYTHDGSSAFTIPTTEKNPDMISAFLEAMSAESYRVVTPAYFETAVKSKYSRDSETSQMLDLVVSGIYLDFGYIFGHDIGRPIDVMRNMLADSTSCENAMSKIKAGERPTMLMTERLLKEYEKIK